MATFTSQHTASDIDGAISALVGDAAAPNGTTVVNTTTGSETLALWSAGAPQTITVANFAAGLTVSNETIDDRVAALITAGDNITAAYDDGANTLTLSVSGTLPDARITQSSVTQHAAAIDHDSLLNYAANEHIDWTAASANFSTSGNITVGGTTTLNTVAYTWPATDGTSGYVLSTDGAGTLSWIAAGGGGGGSDYQALIYAIVF